MKMSWHRQYTGHSIGRVLHFLYYYAGFNVSEHAIISETEVTYFGKIIAKYKFEKDIPRFEFFGEYTFCNEQQKNLREEAISDLNPTYYIVAFVKKGNHTKSVTEYTDIDEAVTKYLSLLNENNFSFDQDRSLYYNALYSNIGHRNMKYDSETQDLIHITINSESRRKY